MRIQAVCIALCAMAPVAANAGNRLDLHYTPIATLGDDEIAAKGDGFGARVHVKSGTALVDFEYSTTDFNDESLDQLRVGLGMEAGESASVHAEYLKWDIFGTDADGFGAHVQFGRPADRGAGGYLRLGYLWMEADDSVSGSIELDGFEYAVGASFPLGTVRGLLEFRSSLLEDEDGFEFFLEDLHLGITVPFGR
ncbi:MAG: hypothetical protein ACRES8_03655 [Nevskiaceae bacterium]